MNDDIPAAFLTIWERVRELAATDPELRNRIRNLADSLHHLTDPPSPVKAPPPPVRRNRCRRSRFTSVGQSNRRRHSR